MSNEKISEKRKAFHQLPPENKARIEIRNEYINDLSDLKFDTQKIGYLLNGIQDEFVRYSATDETVRCRTSGKDHINLLIDMLMDYNDKIQETVQNMLPEIKEQNGIDRQET